MKHALQASLIITVLARISCIHKFGSLLAQKKMIQDCLESSRFYPVYNISEEIFPVKNCFKNNPPEKNYGCATREQ